ncbi:putative DNA-binding transcriptional regulator AlpA [Rhizobium sp. BK181]|uniref:hypothetical protein n=1 Tax=Rhizobium sp. BK181 TaxID=2587072 RepID=UPI00161DEC24|nr:hypothetical protein [Rhizobium sp. BK181]MBB3318945.1 putative DNA-binding transcriptional regulator AlpA [Rhizobium sp. BK181]
MSASRKLQDLPPIEDGEIDIDLGFWSYPDLERRKIVKSRPHLKALQERADFPRPIKTGSDQRASAHWPVSWIQEWVRRRAALIRQSA